MINKYLLRDKIVLTIVHRSLKLVQILKILKTNTNNQSYWEADWIFRQ